MTAPTFLNTVTITFEVARDGGRDARGNPVNSFTSVNVPGCVTWPSDANGTGGNENTNLRDTVIVGRTVLVPPGFDVSYADRFTYNGRQYEVQGQPEPYDPPFNNLNPGILVNGRQVTG